MMDKSTPRPLHKTPWSPVEMAGDPDRKAVAAENGLRFGEMSFDSPADLAFALHAANSHDALVEALRAAIGAIENCHSYRSHNNFDALEQARAALALATAKEPTS